MMRTVALVGADGAGKTTIAKCLVEGYPGSMKYLYMGLSLGSSNMLLPTSRLFRYLKRRVQGVSPQIVQPPPVNEDPPPRATRTSPGYPSRSLHPAPVSGRSHVGVAEWPQGAGDSFRPVTLLQPPEIQRASRGRLFNTARLLNRMAEAWYRQVISWSYQLRGYLVLYDRHFLFEYSGLGDSDQPLSSRVFHWFATHLYPQPDLIILLHAPVDVLLARKREWTRDYLQDRQEAFLQQARTMRNCVLIDATQPPEMAVAEVIRCIMQSQAFRKQTKRHGLT